MFSRRVRLIDQNSSKSRDDSIKVYHSARWTDASAMRLGCSRTFSAFAAASRPVFSEIHGDGIAGSEPSPRRLLRGPWALRKVTVTRTPARRPAKNIVHCLDPSRIVIEPLPGSIIFPSFGTLRLLIRVPGIRYDLWQPQGCKVRT